MKNKIRVILLSLLLLLCSMENVTVYGQEAEDPLEGEIIGDTTEEAVKVLLVGNSFTNYTVNGVKYTIEQPLKELAEAAGHKLEVTTLSHGSARLRYYAGMSSGYISYYKEVLELLMDGSWDYIFFQEHTRAPVEYFSTSTYPAVEKLLQLVKQFQPQAKAYLYATPGFEDGEPTSVNGVNTYLTAAEFQRYLAKAYHTLETELGIEAIPIGMNFLRANIVCPQLQMTGADGKHPTYAGYYLAACSYYEKIFGMAPFVFPEEMKDSTLSSEEMRTLADLTDDKLMLSTGQLELKQGKTTVLTPTVQTGAVPTPYVQFESFDKTVATVGASDGIVTAKSGGTTLILATTSDGLQAFCDVKVRIPLSFARAYYLAGIGDTVQVIPSNNAQQLKWKSSKTSVASVNSSGTVTAKAAGKAVITVTNTADTSDTASYSIYVTCATPTKLTAESYGNPAQNAQAGYIKLSWKAVSGAKSYEIYRSTSANGVYERIGSSTGKSYVDRQAAVNQTYYYKVAAANGYAACTSELSARTRGIIVKAPVLKAKLISKRYAKLTWSKNAKAGGYVIYRSTKKNTGYKKLAVITSKNRTTYTDKTIKKNKTYYYRIKAYKKLDGKVFYGVKTTWVQIRR